MKLKNIALVLFSIGLIYMIFIWPVMESRRIASMIAEIDGKTVQETSNLKLKFLKFSSLESKFNNLNCGMLPEEMLESFGEPDETHKDEYGISYLYYNLQKNKALTIDTIYSTINPKKKGIIWPQAQGLQTSGNLMISSVELWELNPETLIESRLCVVLLD